MLVSRELNSAYRALRGAFGLGTLLAGLDKFTNILADWEKYLGPGVLQRLPFDATTFMHLVGGIEIVVGLAILFGASRTFGYVAMLWLWAIAVNLIYAGIYFDIAVRYILLGVAAFALAKITEARRSVLYVENRDTSRLAA